MSAKQPKTSPARGEQKIPGRSGTPRGDLCAEAQAGEKETPPLSETHLMERCVERANMLKAWKRVKQNRGSAGVDGMDLDQMLTSTAWA